MDSASLWMEALAPVIIYAIYIMDTIYLLYACAYMYVSVCIYNICVCLYTYIHTL